MQLIFVCLLFLSPLWSAEDSSSLNSAGRKRLQSNLQTIEQNLETTKKNLEISRKNQETMLEEQKALAVLEKDYEALQKKYSGHISAAEKELEKNDKAISDLQKFLTQTAPSKGVPTGGDNEGAAQLKKALTEKGQREAWKKESQEKIEKIRALLNSTNESLRKIQARKSPLANQMEIQARRETEYERLLKETESKKSEIERLLSSQ